MALEHLAPNGRIGEAMGDWRPQHHKIVEWYLDAHTCTLYHHVEGFWTNNDARNIGHHFLFLHYTVLGWFLISWDTRHPGWLDIDLYMSIPTGQTYRSHCRKKISHIRFLDLLYCIFLKYKLMHSTPSIYAFYSTVQYSIERRHASRTQ
jgi:hypothetical protein